MKTIKTWLATIAALLFSITANAHDFEVDGIYYEVISDSTVKVTYKGYSYNTYSYEYSGNVVIPSEVTYSKVEYSVTSIGYDAFRDCSGLVSVTIPNSVGSIESYSFTGCTSLTELNIEDGDSELSLKCNGKEGLFHDCPLESIYLGRNISYNSGFDNGYSPFYAIGELESVTIGNSVTEIENNAFYRCNGLTSITIGSRVTSIGQYAFHGCKALKNILNLSKFNIKQGSDGCGYVGYYAEVVVNNPELIDNYAFAPNGDTNVLYGYIGTDTNLQLPENFRGENYIIGDYAFWYRSGLTSVTVPNSVTSIGGSAFKSCSGLTSVTIGNSVTSIGSEAFACSKLQTIIAKNSEVSSIGSEAFSTNIYNHTQVYVPEGTYWNYAFSDWGSFIHIKEMAMNTESLESHKAYMIADASGRNYTVYDATKNELVNIAYTHALDEESEGTCWTVLKEGNASYLYNIGAKKYGTVSENGSISLSDSPIEVNITNTEDGLSINGNARMFILNNNVNFDATSIDELKSGNGDMKAEIYDLSGRRVQKVQKGVCIKNAKLMIGVE